MNSAPLAGADRRVTFRNIAKAQTPTVVNIQTESRAARAGTPTDFGGGGDELLERFFGGRPPQGQRPPRGRSAARRRRRADHAGRRHRLHHRQGRLHPHQQPRRRGRRRRSRSACSAANADESYAAKVVGRDPLTDSALIQLTEMPADAAAGSEVRRLRADAAGRLGHGDRQPVRPRRTPSRVGVISALGRPFRRRRRPRAEHAADRRRDQPGQLRRPAAQRPRRSRRHEHRDLHRRARSRQHRHRLRDADQHVRELLPQLRTGKITRGVIGVEVDIDPLPTDAPSELGLKERQRRAGPHGHARRPGGEGGPRAGRRRSSSSTASR